MADSKDKRHRFGLHNLLGFRKPLKSELPQPPDSAKAGNEATALPQSKPSASPVQQAPQLADGPADVKAVEESKPELPHISLLWHEAYEELKRTAPDEVGRFVHEAATTVGIDEIPADQLFQQMSTVVQVKQKEVEDDWKVKFKGFELSVKDYVKPVVSIVEWSKDYVGKVIETTSSPPASLAWAGVCLVLPFVLNPLDQEALRTQGMEEIAVLLKQCALREETYDMRYTQTESKRVSLISSSSQAVYRSTMKDLYVEILKFEAKVIHFFSNKKGKRLAQEMIMWNDWQTWFEEIIKKREELERVETQYETLVGEEKWKQKWRRQEEKHNETLRSIDAVTAAIKEVQAVIANANRDSDRQKLIQWLKQPEEKIPKMERPEPSPSNSEFSKWLIGNPIFDSWETEPNSFLWLCGKAGSGKSILNSNIVQHLEKKYGNDPFTAIAYFFISFKIETTLDPSILLRTLIAQLLAHRPDMPESLHTLQKRYTASEPPTQGELKDALKAASSGFNRTYIIIDGLDECPNPEDAGAFKVAIQKNGRPRETVLKLLREIRGWGLKSIHLHAGSRPNKDIQDAFHKLLLKPSSNCVDLQDPKYQICVKEDIGRHIDEQLEDVQLLDDNPDLKATTKKSLMDQSDGMFLYVKLQLDLIKLKPITIKSINMVLENLPADLYETYDQILLRVDEKSRRQVIRILTWVVIAPQQIDYTRFSEAPLIEFRSIDEMNVPDLDLSKPLFEESAKFSYPKDIFALVPGLLVAQERRIFGEDEHMINLVHASLRDYLVSKELKAKRAPLPEFALDETKARLQVADTCFRLYIQVKERNSGLPISHLEGYLQHLSVDDALRQGLQILDGIKWEYWPVSWNHLIKRTFFNADGISMLPTWRSVKPAPLEYAIGDEYFDLLKFFVHEGLVDINRPVPFELDSETCHTPLNYGISKHVSTRMIEALLSYGSDIFATDDECDHAFHTCLLYANLRIFRLLLQMPRVLERCKKENFSILIGVSTLNLNAAASALKELVRNIPNVWQTSDRTTIPALHTAVLMNNTQIFHALLDSGADIHVRGQFFGNTLQCAIVKMSTLKMEVLLEWGLQMDPEGPEWDDMIHGIREGTYFVEGAEGGQLAVARLQLAQTIFGNRNHTGDAKSCVVRFFKAAMAADIWSRELNVPWEMLRAQDGQRMPYCGPPSLEQWNRGEIMVPEVDDG